MPLFSPSLPPFRRKNEFVLTWLFELTPLPSINSPVRSLDLVSFSDLRYADYHTACGKDSVARRRWRSRAYVAGLRLLEVHRDERNPDGPAKRLACGVQGSSSASSATALHAGGGENPPTSKSAKCELPPADRPAAHGKDFVVKRFRAYPENALLFSSASPASPPASESYVPGVGAAHSAGG